MKKTWENFHVQRSSLFFIDWENDKFFPRQKSKKGNEPICQIPVFLPPSTRKLTAGDLPNFRSCSPLTQKVNEPRN
jgi:hypothetical protein